MYDAVLWSGGFLVEPQPQKTKMTRFFGFKKGVLWRKQFSRKKYSPKII